MRSEIESALEAWAFSLIQRNFEVCCVLSYPGPIANRSLGSNFETASYQTCGRYLVSGFRQDTQFRAEGP